MKRITSSILCINFLISLILVSCRNDGEEVMDINRILPPPSEVSLKIEGSNRITVTWKDNSSTETEFIVQRIEGLQNSKIKNVAHLAPNTTSFTDTTVFARTVYNYRIFAKNENGILTESVETENATATPARVPTLEVTQINEVFFAKLDSLSPAKSFNITSSQLNNDIIIASPANFLISLGGNTAYSDTLRINLSLSGGIINKIDVKFAPTLSGPHLGDITVSSGNMVRKVGVKGEITQ